MDREIDRCAQQALGALSPINRLRRCLQGTLRDSFEPADVLSERWSAALVAPPAARSLPKFAEVSAAVVALQSTFFTYSRQVSPR